MSNKANYSKKLPQRFLQQAIYKLLKKKSSKSYHPKLIGQKLGVKNSKDSILSALTELERKGKVYSDNRSGYRINTEYLVANPGANKRILQGRIEVIASGAAFVVVEGQERDVYVGKRDINGALHKDLVRLETIFFRNGKRPEGKVIEVLERNRNTFIGTYQQQKKYGYVYVDDGKIELEVKVLPKDANNVEDDSVVVVEVYDFGEKNRNQVLGKVLTSIDQKDRNEFEMNSILIANGFNIAFSKEIIEAANALSDKVTTKDISERLDLRDKNIFTIDPFDAKDFDDALSYEKLENGNFEIGVHIADVTHFVREGSVLDKEALDRSTSVYLVDRVCPMLPERISNELCSLRPNEDKFSFSAIFTFSNEHKIVNQWFGRTLIHSKRRFTYEEAQEILDAGTGDYSEELLSLNTIAKVLKKKRFEKGSIDFESDEVKFVLDEDKKPVDVKLKVRGDSHKLVEEFMLLANKKVAKYIAKKSKPQIPFVYRIHDLPDPERLSELGLLAAEFGIKMKLDTPGNITESLNNLSKDKANAALMKVLKPMAIRTMAKAVYSAKNIGHYGLGFDYYTHFTSPIRRYSDVLVHRLLDKNLSEEHRVNEEKLEEQCLHISTKERSAIHAERESIKYKQVEYLSERIGEQLEGTIRNIIDKGIFVELTYSKSDGMIRFDKFDESFSIHAARIKATGDKTGLELRIGDTIIVEIEGVDIDRKQIEFDFIKKLES